MTLNQREWVRAGVIADVIQRNVNTVRRLAREGLIRTHTVPGSRALYYLPDAAKYAPPPVEAETHAVAG